ncbi:hypothetical protein SAMN02745823_01413 [Sporobacter termitidis DSM 10068]|uniref:Uncharacterized protein n=1 Tax=Sporobacter termitidis DSM 10068 TaxID=1123282 RepID=A0A1M5WVH3_9FIRM|nr:hypothetical protein [Sporobacter termitidis]SHH91587.1 hypothetical protein SAMN02745823_01413 [Sporobacter termitidis DSM 10068]
MGGYKTLDILDIPVQMISLCNADGTISPIRFRFEDGEDFIHTVSITKIVSSKEVQYVGIEAFIYVCRAVLHGEEKQFELKYTVRSHKWVLFRIIY